MLLGGFAGAGGCMGASAPIKTCSPLKRVPHSCQLRLTFLHRKTDITGNHYSGERTFRRRKAPAPIKLAFAGASGWIGAAAPIRIRSPKKSVPQICQLRPTFLRRKKTITRTPYSGERIFRRR